MKTTLLWHVGVTLTSALSLALTACSVTPSPTDGELCPKLVTVISGGVFG